MHVLNPLPVSLRRAVSSLGCAFLLLLAAACCPALGTSAHAQSGHADDSLDEVRAQAPILASTNWLLALDANNSKSTYDFSAAVFKNVMKDTEWAEQVKKRSQLGKMCSRNARTCQFATKMQFGPTGQYCVIYYITSFDKEKFMIERVTVAKEGEHWRVCDYLVGKPPKRA